MKKIIVTAPTSAVASNFMRFAKDKVNIITVGRRNSNIVFDFIKDNELVLPHDVDSILHFAGVLFAESDTEILDMIHANVIGVLKVCMAAKRSNIKQVIFISSINAELAEGSPYFNYYSLSKRQAEEVARLYCKNNHIALCIIRPSQIFGCDWSFSKSQFLLYHMIECALNNKPIKIYGKYDALRNYVFADNLYWILLHVIEFCIDGEIDVVDKRNYELSRVAQIIVDTLQSNSKIYFLEDKADISDNSFQIKMDYFAKWNIPFVNFEKAIQQVGYYCKKKG